MSAREELALLSRTEEITTAGAPPAAKPLHLEPPPRRRWLRERLLPGVAGTVVFAGGLAVYALVQDLTTPRASLVTAWDHAIRFVPASVLVYFLFFPYVALAAFAVRRDEFWRALTAGVAAAVVGWTFFVLLPASLERPDPASVQTPVVRELLLFLHAIDGSHNTFPSLHVAITWIACFCFRWTRVRGRRVFPAAVAVAAAISASTMLVKQHTILDVAGGMLLAVLATALVGRLSRVARSSAGP